MQMHNDCRHPDFYLFFMTSKEYSNQLYLFRLTLTWSAPISTQERKYVNVFFFSISKSRNNIHFGIFFFFFWKHILNSTGSWMQMGAQMKVWLKSLFLEAQSQLHYSLKRDHSKKKFHFVSYRFVMKSVFGDGGGTCWFIIVSLKYGMHYHDYFMIEVARTSASKFDGCLATVNERWLYMTRMAAQNRSLQKKKAATRKQSHSWRTTSAFILRGGGAHSD